MTINKPLDLQELRTLAEKASPGPWWIDSHGHSMSDRNHKTVFQAVDLVKPAFRNPETGNLSHWPNDWDASFIAAANPETVLSLLDTIEILQAECDALREALLEAQATMTSALSFEPVINEVTKKTLGTGVEIIKSLLSEGGNKS